MHIIAVALALLLLVAGCTEGQESSESSLTEEQITQQKIDANFNITNEDFTLVQFEEPRAGDDIAVIETSRGTVRVRLFQDDAPTAVQSFRELLQAGAYDNQPFSLIKSNHLIQSGGSKGAAVFENEYSLNLWHFRGAVGMVNSIGGTTGSQFYIIQNNGLEQEMIAEMEQGGFPASVCEKYDRFGGAPWMDGKYTVFGQVIEGMEIVDDIVLAAEEQANASAAAASAASSSTASSSAAASSAAAPVAGEELKVIKVTLEPYAPAQSAAESGASASNSSTSTSGASASK